MVDCEPVTTDSETHKTIHKRSDLTTWEDAEPELTYISQPKMQEDGVGANFAELNDEYVYDVSSGKRVTVYMLDTASKILLSYKMSADGWKGSLPRS